MLRPKTEHHGHSAGLIRKILRFFVTSKLTPLLVAAALLLGSGAVLLLPREEEPQIVVPVIDVFVQMPGASAKEVEQRVTKPLEKLLWEIPGVEYIYSTSAPGESLTSVRFLVGENEERSIVRLNQKVFAHLDRIPPGASPPLIKPRRIDDVPILALTFHSRILDHYALRRLAAEVDDAIKEVPDVSETTLIGGQRRQVRVELDATRLTAYQLDPSHVLRMLEAANQQTRAGSFPRQNQEVLVETGGFLTDSHQVGSVVVGVFHGQLVYLRDVAEIRDGPEEPVTYVFFGRGRQAPGPVAAGDPGMEEPAVTIAIAKRKDTNAIDVAEAVLKKVHLLEGRLIPEGVDMTVTRHYGHTAADKSNELLFHMALAVVGVSLLIALALGWRGSLVVAVAIPVTLAMTLATFYVLGFTLNRVTLFALIFSIGILVDDPIVDVENIVRHFRLPENHGRPLAEVVIEAVNEVRSPLILATFTVIAAVLPMAFVSGLMGPYMRPIPIGSSAAMLFSMAVSFMITPWAAHRLLAQYMRRHAGQPVQETEDWSTRLYRRLMTPLIGHTLRSLLFLTLISLMLAGAVGMLFTQSVKVKMLPYDNKSELQIILDMDEGTTLEHTAQVARAIAAVVRQEPEVIDYQIYAGTAAPYNFNGLVRHYFLRRGPNVADIQVNLISRHDRDSQSHEIAKRVRERIGPLAREYNARIKVAEVPPGPPVLQTLVAEVYGQDYGEQIENARHIREMFEHTDGVVDVDWYVDADQPKLIFRFDQEKAALHGIRAEQIAEVVKIAQAGVGAGLLHLPEEKEDVVILLRLPIGQRSNVSDMRPLPVATQDGRHVPLGELVRLVPSQSEKSIYRKNLLPVVYVTGDVAGAQESPVYAILKLNQALASFVPVGSGTGQPIEIWSTRQPFSTLEPSMKWDGEWHITYEVFRDLGFAFAVVLILIYILVVGWFRSFRTPFIIMAAIPFSLVGILPAHWALGAFFTATSMIGFIAGAGIVVRNSIILVDFIHLRLRQGMPLAEAVVDAGAIRFRPMMLTAAAVIVGGSVILFDPIFQGLAISLMAGEVASLLLSRLAVPVIFYLWMSKIMPHRVHRHGRVRVPHPAEKAAEGENQEADKAGKAE